MVTPTIKSVPCNTHDVQSIICYYILCVGVSCGHGQLQAFLLPIILVIGSSPSYHSVSRCAPLHNTHRSFQYTLFLAARPYTTHTVHTITLCFSFGVLHSTWRVFHLLCARGSSGFSPSPIAASRSRPWRRCAKTTDRWRTHNNQNRTELH